MFMPIAIVTGLCSYLENAPASQLSDVAELHIEPTATFNSLSSLRRLASAVCIRQCCAGGPSELL